MDWTSLIVGAVLGAILSEVIGVSVTLFYVERLLRRRDYRENSRVRCFAYARTFEVANGVLHRLLPDDLYVEYPCLYHFGEVQARRPGSPLVNLLTEEGVVEIADRERGVVCQTEHLTALRGYLVELDNIIMGFGRLNESHELEDVVALSRALNVFVRSEGDREGGNSGGRSIAEIAAYLNLVVRAQRLCTSLERVGARSHPQP